MPAATSHEDAYHQGGNSLMERQFDRHQRSQEHYLAMFMDQFEIMRSSPVRAAPAVSKAAAATATNSSDSKATANKPIQEINHLRQKHCKQPSGESKLGIGARNDGSVEFGGEQQEASELETTVHNRRTYQHKQQQQCHQPLPMQQPYLINDNHNINKHSKNYNTTPDYYCLTTIKQADDGNLLAQFEPLDLDLAGLNYYYLQMTPPNGHQQAANNHYLYQQHQHYLTLEELKVARNSCWLCGCNWQQDHVSLDCLECGGYALSRPCPTCDGQCNQVWQRNITETHDRHKALWIGQCGKQEQEVVTGSSEGTSTTKLVSLPQEQKKQQQQTQLAPSSCCSSQPSSAASSDSEFSSNQQAAATKQTDDSSSKSEEGAGNCLVGQTTTKQQQQPATTTSKDNNNSKTKTASNGKSSGKQPKHYQKQLCVCN